MIRLLRWLVQSRPVTGSWQKCLLFFFKCFLWEQMKVSWLTSKACMIERKLAMLMIMILHIQHWLWVNSRVSNTCMSIWCIPCILPCWRLRWGSPFWIWFPFVTLRIFLKVIRRGFSGWQSNKQKHYFMSTFCLVLIPVCFCCTLVPHTVTLWWSIMMSTIHSAMLLIQELLSKDRESQSY
jgi:hypothetical protein